MEAVFQQVPRKVNLRKNFVEVSTAKIDSLEILGKLESRKVIPASVLEKNLRKFPVKIPEKVSLM